jgi:ubiquinol-cytochrome c reductase cytochrome c1 subunit
MKKIILIACMALAPAFAWAAGGGVALDKAPVNVSDTASLKRGAETFVNYCLSCHSAKFMRYNRIGADLGMSDDEVKESLIKTGAKVGSTMDIAMSAEKAEKWFGITPPDLSVLVRAKGADYVYTYLRTFHADEKRPFGVNNKVLANASMPHVLWQQQEKMTPEQYDSLVGDLVNYMTYMAEPAQLQRAKYGPWVLLFIFIFTVLAYLMKKEYWKDIH